MSDSDRQQRMVERVLEDERLRGDLEDEAASALVKWASEQAAMAAADPARSDEVVEAQVQAVRAAAREAARSGESDPQRLVAEAQAALTQRQAALPSATPESTAAAVPAADAAPAPGTAAEPAPKDAPQPPSSPPASRAAAEPAPKEVSQPPSSSSVRATSPQSRSDTPRRGNRLSRWLKRLRAGR